MSKEVQGPNAVQQFMLDMNSRAEKLYQIRREIERKEAEYKASNEALWNEENELKGKLIDDLKAINLKSIKVASGDSFAIVKKTKFGFDPHDPRIITWAKENNLVSIDKELARAKLNILFKDTGTLPEGITAVDTESITVRKAQVVKDTKEVTEE